MSDPKVGCIRCYMYNYAFLYTTNVNACVYEYIIVYIASVYLLPLSDLGFYTRVIIETELISRDNYHRIHVYKAYTISTHCSCVLYTYIVYVRILVYKDAYTYMCIQVYKHVCYTCI